MKEDLLPQLAELPSEELIMVYMDLVSRQEGEEVFRLLDPIGQGIMKHTHIANGIELVYSELESYNPHFQTEKKEIDSIEIMYIVEGHGDFELMNRQFVSGDKGDVMFFNSQTATKKSILGKSGMNCISLVIFPAQAVDFLNSFLSTSEFTSDDFFNEVRKTDSCISFPAGELLESLFLEMVQRPGAHSKYYVKLAVVHALLLMMNNHQSRNHSDLYFSGSSGKKVQQVRRLINANLEVDISIEELADKVKMNRTSLQKIFKEMYGVTINTYRTQTRIQMAKNLLVSTELPITEIAGRCGYSNASKFSSVFKRNCNMLPKDWRQKSKN
ncbi:MAG: AraC family transcriptional regulator [Treponema sp.]|nr:AraC family transcriptional regulator [Treponema sp.]